MSPVCISWLVAVSGFFVLVASHVLVLRIRSPRIRLGSLNKSILAFLPVVLLAAYFVSNAIAGAGPLATPTRWVLLTQAVVVAVLLLIASLAFYSAVEHSVRLRIFVELYRNGNAPMTLEAMLQRYDPHESGPLRRLQQLVLAGYLEQERDQYRLTAKGLLFARMSSFGKRLLKSGLGG